MAETDSRVVRIDDRNASAWPECREALGLNSAGPDRVEGVEVVSTETTETGLFTRAVELRFASPEALESATNRLFEQASEMFEYGIHDGAGDVQDFAASLPHPTEVFG